MPENHTNEPAEDIELERIQCYDCGAVGMNEHEEGYECPHCGDVGGFDSDGFCADRESFEWLESYLPIGYFRVSSVLNKTGGVTVMSRDIDDLLDVHRDVVERSHNVYYEASYEPMQGEEGGIYGWKLKLERIVFSNTLDRWVTDERDWSVDVVIFEDGHSEIVERES